MAWYSDDKSVFMIVRLWVGVSIACREFFASGMAVSTAKVCVRPNRFGMDGALGVCAFALMFVSIGQRYTHLYV